MSNTSMQSQQPKFSVAITTKGYQNLINNTLGDPKRAQRFVAAITSAVAVNPQLQDCDAGSILAGGLLGESLGLSPSPQLGQYYLVPFKQKAKYDRSGHLIAPECLKAQFVLGYKGYIQLAIKSGYYKKLNVLEIKEGELQGFDPLNEVIDCVIIEDYAAREKAETIGYYAMFEYTNGFKKAMYWSKAKMISHADKYSQAFSKDAVKARDPKYNKVSFADFEAGKVKESDMWLYSSFWYKDFDGMAYKTMLRQLISKWGIMSIDMQTAMNKDMAAIHDDGSIDYVDGFADSGEAPPTADGNTIDIDPATGEVLGEAVDDAPLPAPEATDAADPAGFFD